MSHLRIRTSQKRVPFGGHHYREDGVMMKGDTPEEVVDMIANFRLINGRPLGNPMRDLVNYYAKHFPWMVEIDTSPPPDDEQNEYYIQWRDWISENWGKPQQKHISNREAKSRLAVCAKCPHNVGRPWDENEESREFSRKALMLRRGEIVDGKICFCSLHKADLSVSCFAESPAPLSKNKNETAPGFCWFNNSEGA